MRGRSDSLSYSIGVLTSLFAHLVCVFIVIGVLEKRAAQALRQEEIFTVTLEGGEKLGGIAQVPTSDKPDIPPAVPEESSASAQETVEVNETKPISKKAIEKPTVIDQLEEKKKKEREEKKKKAEELKKKKEIEKKKQLDAEKKRQADKKRKAEEAKKKKAEDKKRREEAKKRKAEERKNRERKLADAINRATNKRYEGESANAGGEGFGAAALGGKGGGGGTLASLEFVAYRNQLESHIKAGWHWIAGQEVLRTKILVVIQQNGDIRETRVLVSSGREDFDQSVLRAVQKASPVPAAPEHLYSRFREVRITFDSHD